MTNLLRIRKEYGHGRVTFIELFFDLVFVFAVTQLSHTLLQHFNFLTALRVGLLTMAVWWVWIYTSWVTNWLDPEKNLVRVLLLLLMLAGLILSASIPEAFDGKGMTFALTYTLMQVGRTAFMLWTVWHIETRRHNFIRILLWLAVAGIFWITGAFFPNNIRFFIWLIALLIEYISPSLGFWIPVLGKSNAKEWDVAGAHLAERCALFIIIALGESILVTGAKFSTLPWNLPTLLAFFSSFIGSVAMWWLYFDGNADFASNQIVRSDNPGSMARWAYTYIHLFLVAGIIVSAVADEFILANPLHCMGWKLVITILSAPLLYLIGNVLFKRVVFGKWVKPSIVGIAVLLGLFTVASYIPPLILSMITTVLMVAIAMVESYLLKTRCAVIELEMI